MVNRQLSRRVKLFVILQVDSNKSYHLPQQLQNTQVRYVIHVGSRPPKQTIQLQNVISSNLLKMLQMLLPHLLKKSKL